MVRGEAARRARREAVVTRVRQIYNKAAEEPFSPFYQELEAFTHAFQKHFGKWQARRYVLFHWASGSTPIERADRFDARDAWSVAAKLEELAGKYMQGP